jgi:hypothetical protein
MMETQVKSKFSDNVLPMFNLLINNPRKLFVYKDLMKLNKETFDALLLPTIMIDHCSLSIRGELE